MWHERQLLRGSTPELHLDRGDFQAERGCWAEGLGSAEEAIRLGRWDHFLGFSSRLASSISPFLLCCCSSKGSPGAQPPP